MAYTDKQKEETITVTTHVGQLSEEPDLVLRVEATVGTYTGVLTPIYTGTPTATTQVLVEGDTLTFAAADAVTEANVIYRKDITGCAKAMEDKSAGLMCTVYVNCTGE